MPPETTVLVDARNVLRSVWPNMAEHELVERVRAWAETEEVHAIVVFDGPAPEELGDERCDVVGTAEESADDRIAQLAAQADAPYWLVTSDRDLRSRAGGRADRVVGGGGFARELLALDSSR